MRTVGAVVLNYKKYEETIQCVNSLLKQEMVKMNIVIVDNGSGNESAKVLRKIFGNEPNVSIITSEQNLGYAKGNNLGIRELLRRHVNFIMIINSDAILSSSVIYSQLMNGYESGVGILVPIVRNLDGSLDQRTAYKKKLVSLRILKGCTYSCFYSWGFPRKKTNNNNQNAVVEMYRKRLGIQTDCFVVSGSAYVLTADFFEHYCGLYPETFLYAEELGIILYLSKAHLLSKIINTDVIIHKGAASTDSSVTYGTKKHEKIAAKSARKMIRLALMPRWYIHRKYSTSENIQ